MPAVIAAPRERAKGTVRLDTGRGREGRCRGMVGALVCGCVRVSGPPAAQRDCVSSGA